MVDEKTDEKRKLTASEKMELLRSALKMSMTDKDGKTSYEEEYKKMIKLVEG